MKTLSVLFLNGCLFINPLHAQSAVTSDTVSHSTTAIAIRIDYYRFGGGIGGKYWVNNNVALRAEFVARYEEDTFGVYSKIAPSVSVERHFHTQANVSPFIAIRVNPEWTLQNRGGPRYTILNAGIVFGVESWVFKNISVAGEALFGSEYYLNSDRQTYQAEETSLSLCFYF